MTRAQKPRLVVPPAEMPVSLDEAKAHLRVEHDADDTLLAAGIAAAVAHLDGHAGILGRCLVAQDWSLAIAGFGCGVIALPFPDAADVAVSYYPADGSAETALPTTVYHLVDYAGGPALVLASGQSWPATSIRPDAVTVTATYGYGTAADVPAAIKAAILLMVGDLYKVRETAAAGTVTAIPSSTTVEALLAPYRYGFFG